MPSQRIRMVVGRDLYTRHDGVDSGESWTYTHEDRRRRVELRCVCVDVAHGGWAMLHKEGAETIPFCFFFHFSDHAQEK